MDSESGENIEGPLRKFRGWLKCQRPYHTNELGKLVTATSFPLFDPNESEDFVTYVDMVAKEQVRQQIIEEFPEAPESVINSELLC